MTEILRHFKKGPGDDLKYCFDWTPWLQSIDAGETISESEWDVPTDLTVSDEQTEASKTSCFIAGGSVGETYTISNQITTSGEQIAKRSFAVTIVEL